MVVIVTAIALLAGTIVNREEAQALPWAESSESRLMLDTFARSVPSGWGKDGNGVAYVTNAPDELHVDGNAGVIDLSRAGGTRTVRTRTHAAADLQVSTILRLDSLPNHGKGVYAAVQLRSDGVDHYRALLRFDPSGDVFLSIARITDDSQQVIMSREQRIIRDVAADTPIALQGQISGADPVTVRARGWVVDRSVPDWQATGVDRAESRLRAAGSAGLWTYLSSASEPAELRVDALQIDRAEGRRTAKAKGSDAEDRVRTTGTRSSVGAPAVGTADYHVPKHALFVAPSGSDRADGTRQSPLKTLKRAIDVAGANTTIVLRSGTYHESVVIPESRRVTIQPYPGETVWLDGSVQVTGWKQAGDHWAVGGWEHTFDSSPTYRRGAPDGSAVGWSFVNPDYPMAAHPDQVWIDSSPQRQVARASDLRDGTFFVDTDRERLLLGSNPRGREVRASTLSKAMTIVGAGSVVRGIGIRRYAPSVPDLGAVTVNRPDVVLEDLVITDMATTGLSVIATDVTVRNLTAARNGMLGVHANEADRLSITGLLAAENNIEHFNRAPVAGGTKISRTQEVTVDHSAFLDNLGHGLWFDESVADGTVTSSDLLRNTGAGVVTELSTRFVYADNLIVSNRMHGIWMINTDKVEISNNTLLRNDRNINLTMDKRRADNPSTPGHDPRHPQDPSMSWITRQVRVVNNVVQEPRGACLVCVEDHSRDFSAVELKIRLESNLYQRPSAKQPRWFAVWARGSADPEVFDDLAAFSRTTKQDEESLVVEGRRLVDDRGRPQAGTRSMERRVASDLSPTVAQALARERANDHVGAWTP